MRRTLFSHRIEKRRRVVTTGSVAVPDCFLTILRREATRLKARRRVSGEAVTRTRRTSDLPVSANDAPCEAITAFPRLATASDCILDQSAGQVGRSFAGPTVRDAPIRCCPSRCSVDLVENPVYRRSSPLLICHLRRRDSTPRRSLGDDLFIDVHEAELRRGSPSDVLAPGSVGPRDTDRPAPLRGTLRLPRRMFKNPRLIGPRAAYMDIAVDPEVEPALTWGLLSKAGRHLRDVPQARRAFGQIALEPPQRRLLVLR